MLEVGKSTSSRRIWRFYKKINGRIFLVCLAISSFIWLLRNLSKEIESHIPVHVELRSVPANCVWLDTQPNEIEVEIESVGFSLIGSGFFRKERILELDFATYPCKNGVVALPTSGLRGQITRLIGREQTILNIYPDTIRFEFSKAVTMDVPVQVPFETKLIDGNFLTANPVAIPGKLTVSGPASVLDTLSTLYTEKITISSPLSDTLSVPLNTPPYVQLPRQEVQVAYVVDAYTEVNYRVPIRLPHVLKSEKIKLFPDSVTLTCLAGAKQLAQISADSFQVEIDSTDLAQIGELEKLNLKITQIPQGISEVKIRPGRIEYLILKER